jgi:tetratricopeptide (TPR) repeat protein
MNTLSALYYLHENKFNEALIEFRKVQELNPDRNFHYDFFETYVKLGEDLLAIEELQKALLRDSLIPEKENFIKDVFNKSGMNGLFQLLIELELKKSWPNSWDISRWYALMDRRDESLIWLEKAFVESTQIPRINCDPTFDNLRSEPRFIALIEKMGLSNYGTRD